MKKKLVAITIIIAFLSQPVYGLKESVFIYEVEYIYDNLGEVTYFLSEDDLTLPLGWDDEWHQIKIINSSHPLLQNEKDVDGNRISVIEMDREIPPGEKITFDVTYSIHSTAREMEQKKIGESGGKDSIPQSLIVEYCMPTGTFNYSIHEIGGLASRLAGEQEQVLSIVTDFVDWISTNLTYGNFDLPRLPNETLSTGVGDCDDQAILLISMLRSQNIPSYLQLGIVVNERIENNRMAWDEHLEIKQGGVGWHGWAMVYIPPWGWTPIDLTLTQGGSAIEIINDSPQYAGNVIPFVNINKQKYIEEASETRANIINSSIYVIINESGQEMVKVSNNNLLLFGTGFALIASIIIMIYLGKDH